MAGRREYEMLFQLNAQVGGSYSTAFSKAQAQVSAMQQKIVDLGKNQSDIAAYQKQQSAIEATRKKLETLQQQYDNIQNEIGETEGFSSNLENKLLSKNQAIEKTNASLERHNQKLQQLSTKLEDAGVDTGNLTQENERLAAKIKDLQSQQQGVIDKFNESADRSTIFGTKTAEAFELAKQAIAAAGIAKLLQEIGGAMMECTDASIAYESALAGVYKTVDGTDQQLASISDEIKEMSTEIPATTEEIAAVAEAAGQLGIATGDIMAFTEVMINLGESTNLSAEGAASSLAKFTNITGTVASDYSRLGSTIVDLGNNFATTEADIVSMATRLASSGKLAGLTEPEIMALAAAMSSVGIEAEAGGTAMTQTLSEIEKAVATGGDTLEEFARISGMSADEFAMAWKESPIIAIQAFITGIGELADHGESAVTVLDDLGLSGIRQSNMLKSLGLAAGTLTRAVTTANSAWNKNVALSAEAEMRYATTESKLAMLNNSYNNLKIAIGDVYTPALRNAADAGTELLDGMAEFVERNPGVVKMITSLGVGLVAAGAAIGSVTLVTKLATPVMTAFNAVLGMNPAVLVTAGVIGLGSAIASLCAMTADDAVPSVNELTQAAQAMNEAVEESTATYNDTVASTMAAARVAETYIAKLQELEAAGIDTDEEAKQYHNTLALLCEIVPELSEYIDLENDVIRGGTEALIANTEAWKQNAIQQAYQEHLVNVNKAYADVLIEAEKNSIRLTEATIAREAAEKNVAEIEEKLAAARAKETADTAGMAESDYDLAAAQAMASKESNKLTGELLLAKDARDKAEKAEKSYREAIQASSDEVAAAEEGISLAEEAVKNLTSATEEGIDSQRKNADQFREINDLLDYVSTNMETLSEAYTIAYNAAIESVSGQYDIWENAATVIPTSIYSINSALDSQISYWQDYNSNLQTLSARSGEIEGLRELLSSFADGSTESVNAIAGMATASDEKLAAIVKEWQALQKEQQGVADSIADLKTDYTSEMDKLTSEVAGYIDDMNLSSDAAISGKNTIQGFIDGSSNMLPKVKQTFEKLAQEALDAFDRKMEIHSPSKVMEDRADMTWAGYINETRALEPKLRSAMAEAAGAGVDAATVQMVTLSPELVSAVTDRGYAVNAVTEAGGAPVSIQVTFQISGNVTPEVLETLDMYGEEFAERVRSIVEDADVDTARRRY